MTERSWAEIGGSAPGLSQVISAGHVIVQQPTPTTATSTAPSITFSSTPTTGHCLFLVCGWSSGSVTATPPSGFTRVGVSHGNGGAEQLELWKKTSAGNESGALTATLSSSVPWELFALQVSGLTNNLDVEAESVDGTSFSVTTQASGTTGTTSTAKSLAIAAFHTDNNSLPGTSYSNSFVKLATGGDTFRGHVATKDLTTTGTQTTTITFGATVSSTGAIWIFPDA